ncbi:hypothetical protein AALA78_16480 [Lachnospiraceae bacterium 42-17]
MKPEYIQLPPLPSDLPAEVIEMIWLYTRLSVEEQEMIREFIRENLKKGNRNLEETDFAKVLRDSEAEENPDVKEFIDLMRKLTGILIAQSCEMAALVYQNYCIEKKSTEDISEEFNVDQESIQLMVQYYDKKIKL